MAKALAIGASIAAIAAVTVVTGGAALGLGVALSTSAFGVSASALLATSAVLSAGSSLLAPKPKAPAGLSQSDRLTVSINVREPRKAVFGITAMATDLRDQEWTSDQTYLHRFIVLASHRINAVREIWFDDKLAWTAAGGAQGEFARWLQVTPVLEGSAANAINIGPRMGGARRFTGCAYVHIRYQILAHSKKLDSVFNQSVPSRVTIVGEGASVYDPRRDSTVPGGSGPQRANDQSTWEWNASASRNPALCTLFYLLGWRIGGKLAVGKGIPPARIDLASFIDAANLCDEPVAKALGGTEPRYRCDGVISEGDDTQAVLDNLKATMNAVLDDVDGRLRVSVLHNDLAAPIGDLFTGDVLGAFTWQQTLPLNDSVSVIRGTFVDPSPTSLYQTPDYPEVTIASRDGIERSQTVNYPLVQSPSQAQRLSKQRLQRMLYGGTFSAVFQTTAWKFQKGDVIRLTFAPLGWDRKLFRIADMATQVDGKVPMMLREEHPAIYAWDASDAAPVAGVEPTRYDPALWPLIQGVIDAGTTAEWDKVADPAGTKPADNATNSADPDSPFGPGRTVGETIAKLDAIEDIAAPIEAIALLEKASADRTAAERQMQHALDMLADAILRVTGEAGHTREVLRDAGIVADPATGTVRIYALDLLAEQTSARLAQVGITLDAVKGSLTSKVERSEFTDLATDVGSVEQVLSSVGGASGLSFTARQARFAGADGAETGLRALLAGDEASRRQLTQIAEVRQEVFAKITDAQTAEAFARQLLNVQVGAVDARLATEILTRIAEGEAFARDIRALGVTAGDLATSITRADEARIRGDEATVQSARNLIVASETTTGRAIDAVGDRVTDAEGAISTVRGRVTDAEGAIRAVEQAVIDGDGVSAEAIRQVSARLNNVGGVTIEEKFQTTAERLGLVEGRYSLAIDTNGNLIGFQLIGSGAGPGSFNLINTDLRMGTGRVVFNNGRFMRVQGTGFGRFNDLLSWYGPTMAISDCTIGNALSGETANGISKIGGLLVAGRFSNQAASTGLTANEVAVLGPIGGAGGQVRVSASWLYERTSEQTYEASQDGRAQFEQQAAFYGATNNGVEWFGTKVETVPASTITLTRTFTNGTVGQLDQQSFSTQTTTMRGFAPVIGDAPGRAYFREQLGGGFTVADPVQAASDRTLRLTLSRGVNLGGSGIVQRLSIIAIEE